MTPIMTANKGNQTTSQDTIQKFSKIISLGDMNFAQLNSLQIEFSRRRIICAAAVTPREDNVREEKSANSSTCPSTGTNKSTTMISTW